MIADYIECGSYRATAKKNGVAIDTVKKYVLNCPDLVEKSTQKKEKNTEDMLLYMDSKKEKAKEIIDQYLSAMADPQKLKETPLPQIATAMGIVIDKFVIIPEKNKIEEKKIEIEMIKLESRLKDTVTEETADNFIDALNSTAAQVWEQEKTEEDKKL